MGRQIYFLAQEMSNFAEKVLKPFGITLEQLHLLKCIAKEKGMTQRAICEVVYKTPANTTRILDRLEGKALVERRENPDDRRAFLVFLTDKGRYLFDVVDNIFDSFSENFLGGVTDKEQKVVSGVLKKMSDNLLKMSEELKK